MSRKIFLLALLLLAFSSLAYGQVNNPPTRNDYGEMVLQAGAPAAPKQRVSQVTFTGTGINDATFTGTYSQQSIATFTLTITTAGATDKFDWAETGGSAGSGSAVSITGSAQSLADGISVTFGATTGHVNAVTWAITYTPTGRTYWDTTGALYMKWSNGTSVQMAASGGGAMNLSVANGGTGKTTMSAYAILAGGTTSTGALQQVSGLGSSGQVLTSNGAAALPTWQAVSSGPSGVAGTTGKVLVNGGTSAVTSGTATVSLGTDVPLLDAANNFSADTNQFSNVKIGKGVANFGEVSLAANFGDTGSYGILFSSTGLFLNAPDTTELDLRINNSTLVKLTQAYFAITPPIKFATAGTTGAASATWTNAPVAGNPIQYVLVQLSDGTQGYIPILAHP